MQVFLSCTVYVEVAENFMVSPGSTVLFTSTLFAILLIYIKEDASETRKLVYALLIANVAMSALILSIGWNFNTAQVYNPYHISAGFFHNNAWILFVGTMALFVDALLIIIVYEFLSKKIPGVFWQVSATMLIVVTFDTLFYSLLALQSYDNLTTLIVSGLLSKGAFALLYSLIFSSYLKYLATKEFKGDTLPIKDAFMPLSYRQKYEVAQLDAIKTSEEAKETEIKYRTLTNISPVGIFHTRADGHTTYTNPRWSEISGISMKEALGYGWLKAVHPDDVEQIKIGWKDTTRQNRESEVQYRFLWPDGTVKWVLGRAVPELNEQNEIPGYIGTITDITEIKLYQQEQTRLKEKAQESDRLKTAFLANLSHEIRTPMSGILGFADLLNEPELSPEAREEYTATIKKSSERMLHTIQSIVHISKIESGMVAINLAETNINNVLHSVHDMLHLEAEKKNLTLTINCITSDKEATISTDREKIDNILFNLVNNAIKYTDSGVIELGYIKKESEVEFYVKDTGIGICKEKQEIIFNRFIKSDGNAYKIARQGIGLGLPISKAYAEMLGGRIRLESEDSQGTTFYFTLPTTTL
jgi:PAS domain S-box-containing protein